MRIQKENKMNKENARNQVITDSEALNTWHTKPVPFIIGILIAVIYARIPLPDSLLTVDLIIAGLFFIFGIVYALKIYPSYFTVKPMIRNSNVISFLNGLCGSIIFGCIWNSNLTNRKKGVSNIVYVVVIILSAILMFVAAFAMGLYLL